MVRFADRSDGMVQKLMAELSERGLHDDVVHMGAVIFHAKHHGWNSAIQKIEETFNVDLQEFTKKMSEKYPEQVYTV